MPHPMVGFFAVLIVAGFVLRHLEDCRYRRLQERADFGLIEDRRRASAALAASRAAAPGSHPGATSNTSARVGAAPGRA